MCKIDEQHKEKLNLYSDVLALIQTEVKKLKPFVETVSLKNACGRVLAESLFSNESIPAFINSSMDGFAVRSSEIAQALSSGKCVIQVLSRVIAGDSPGSVFEKNVAVEIMTGAPIPEGGFDAVVKIEDVLKIVSGIKIPGSAFSIEISSPVIAGQNIRLIGTDFMKGDCIANQGDVVDSKLVLGMAALGVVTVSVIKKPKVWILSTGNEIVDQDCSGTVPRSGPGSVELRISEIRNATSPFLIEELSRLGCEVSYRGIFKDQAVGNGEYERALQAALSEQVDLIISTGAVSMGVHDFAKESVIHVGGEVLFHKVAIRPGKPILFAKFEKFPRTYFFGLPGNPISTVVGTEFFVKPFIYGYQGRTEKKPILAILTNACKKPTGLRCFYKAHWQVSESGESQVEVLEGQHSFMIHSLIKANAWVVLPEAADSMSPGQVNAGEKVEVYLFEGAGE